jgi:hypothetical protein
MWRLTRSAGSRCSCIHLQALDVAPWTHRSHLTRVGKVWASEGGTGPTITAVLERGPLAGRRIEVDVVEGRPPKTIDAPADDGGRCRYCLADWAQAGSSAIYTFLYRV